MFMLTIMYNAEEARKYGLVQAIVLNHIRTMMDHPDSTREYGSHFNCRAVGSFLGIEPCEVGEAFDDLRDRGLIEEFIFARPAQTAKEVEE